MTFEVNTQITLSNTKALDYEKNVLKLFKLKLVFLEFKQLLDVMNSSKLSLTKIQGKSLFVFFDFRFSLNTVCATKVNYIPFRFVFLDTRVKIGEMKTQLKQSLGALYNNIDLITLSPYDLFSSTPISRITREVFNSSHKAVHLSDIARVVLLYKYGGIYSDSDGFLVRNIDKLGDTFIARTPIDNVANGFLAARKNSLFLLEILSGIADNFIPTRTYYQIFDIHTKTVRRYCTEACKVYSSFNNINHKNLQCCELKILRKLLISNKKFHSSIVSQHQKNRKSRI